MRNQNINVVYLLTGRISNISYSRTAENKNNIIRFQNISDAYLLTAQKYKKGSLHTNHFVQHPTTINLVCNLGWTN